MLSKMPKNQLRTSVEPSASPASASHRGNGLRRVDAMEEMVRRAFEAVWREQEDESPPLLQEDTVLLDTGLDSLGFAVLVTRLEEDLGYDPFSLSDDAFYPQTFGEFVRFYEQYAAST